MAALFSYGLLTVISIAIGLIFTIIGVFIGHIILFDSIFLAAISGIVCNQIWSVTPGALCDNRNRIIGAAVLAAKHKGRILDNRRVAISILGVCVRLLRSYLFRRRYDMVLCRYGARFYCDDGAPPESEKCLRPCTMEICITGNSADGKQHSQHMEKPRLYHILQTPFPTAP